MNSVDNQRIPVPDLGPPNWSRRYKENLERLRSGDRAQIAEVVRQLSSREQAAGISPGESRMFARARHMLDDGRDGPAGVREPRRPFPPDDALGRTVPEWQPVEE
jgi:CarD family transcriptional regulator, regulator of rRNA transcription